MMVIPLFCSALAPALAAAAALDTLETASAAPATRAAIFDVREFGAKADATTNDAAAIEQAYAACRLAGGGTVLFASGLTFATGPLKGG